MSKPILFNEERKKTTENRLKYTQVLHNDADLVIDSMLYNEQGPIDQTGSSVQDTFRDFIVFHLFLQKNRIQFRHFHIWPNFFSVFFCSSNSLYFNGLYL